MFSRERKKGRETVVVMAERNSLATEETKEVIGGSADVCNKTNSHGAAVLLPVLGVWRGGLDEGILEK